MSYSSRITEDVRYVVMGTWVTLRLLLEMRDIGIFKKKLKKKDKGIKVQVARRN